MNPKIVHRVVYYDKNKNELPNLAADLHCNLTAAAGFADAMLNHFDATTAEIFHGARLRAVIHADRKPHQRSETKRPPKADRPPLPTPEGDPTP